MKKINYVLVDFESVQAQAQVGAQLADEHFRLIHFMGANQARIDVALAKALQPLGQRGGAGRVRREIGAAIPTTHHATAPSLHAVGVI
jgi:hypothetical protein